MKATVKIGSKASVSFTINSDLMTFQQKWLRRNTLKNIVTIVFPFLPNYLEIIFENGGVIYVIGQYILLIEINLQTVMQQAYQNEEFPTYRIYNYKMVI